MKWLALLLVACTPPHAGAIDGGSTGADGGGQQPAVRSCEVALSFTPEQADAEAVFLAGEWDWAAREPLDGPDASGAWHLARELPAGVHAYKFVTRLPGGEERWSFDPANPYRKYSGGTENSGLRVPDCALPLLEVDSFAVAGGRVTASVRVLRGAGGEPIASVRAAVRHDFTDAEVDAPLDGDHLTIDAPAAPGKDSLIVEATDSAGHAAESVLRPFWIEEQPFDWHDAVIYMAMIDRFADGDPGNDAEPTPGAEPSADWQGGDLRGVTAAISDGSLDQLGVRALWLSPWQRQADDVVVDGEGVTGYHGYWPVRAREVDPRYGSEADLEALVTAAHGHGIRVLMDFVANHVHADHEYVGAHPDWFRSGCRCGTDGCDWTTHRLDCVFNERMPDVNWTNPEAAEQMLSDAQWWLERFDLDGLRVDAVKHVEDAAIRDLSVRVHDRFELGGTEYFLLGETAMGWSGDDLADNLGEYDTISRYLGPWGLNGQFDFVLYHAVSYRVFAEATRGLIHADYWTHASLDHYPAEAIMTPYLGSHDTPRFLTRVDHGGDPITFHRWPSQGLPAAPSGDRPYRRDALAMAWLLTLPGAPLIYAGDEYGEFGGADPDNRHMLRPAAQRSAAESWLRDQVAALGAARRRSVALRRGDYQTLRAEEQFLAYARRAGDDVAVIVLNTSDADVTRTLDVGDGPAALTDALAPDAAPLPVSGGQITLTLPAGTAAVLLP
ncbi:MAG TPA: alpha-amylase family glycosyl hydrolase [Kofleriaceae bacterium]|nr:alpha-amylase family glycosyl hydrolase [Kofleriaceae bacterium]